MAVNFGDLTLLGVISHLQASESLENGAVVLFCCLFLMGQNLLGKQCIFGDVYLRSKLSRKSLLASTF